jgi:hypothetical protein
LSNQFQGHGVAPHQDPCGQQCGGQSFSGGHEASPKAGNSAETWLRFKNHHLLYRQLQRRLEIFLLKHPVIRVDAIHGSFIVVFVKIIEFDKKIDNIKQPIFCNFIKFIT